MILLVDNYDSFTFNLYQYLGELGADVKVVRNDAMSVDEALALQPERIVISPGPGTPDEAGISLELIRRSPVPLLGVCLGHQALGQTFGGKVVRAPKLMHGKTSEIRHDGQDDLRGPARRLHRDALPLAGGGAGERPRLPRGVGLDGRRRRDGPAPPRAAARGRAVPPREHPHHRRQGPAAQLPRPRREGQHQAPPREAGPRRAARPRTRPPRPWARSWTARRRRPRSARSSRRWPRAARPRTRWWASPARCASRAVPLTLAGRRRHLRHRRRRRGHLQHLDRGVVRGRRLRRAGGQARQPLGQRHLRQRRRARGARRPHRRAGGHRAAGARRRRAGPSCSRRSSTPRPATRPRPAQGDGRAHRLQPARPAHEPRAARRARWSACRGPELAPFVARCLQRLGTKRAWVVNGSGLDELTLAGPTTVAELDGDDVRTLHGRAGGRGPRERPARGAARRRPAGERGDRARGALGRAGAAARRRAAERRRGARGRGPGEGPAGRRAAGGRGHRRRPRPRASSTACGRPSHERAAAIPARVLDAILARTRERVARGAGAPAARGLAPGGDAARPPCARSPRRSSRPGAST